MHPIETRIRQSARWLCAVLPWAVLGSVMAQSAPAAGTLPSPPPFSAMPVGAPDSGWRVAGLPKQKFPLTRFDVMAYVGDVGLSPSSSGKICWHPAASAPWMRDATCR